MQPVDPFSKYFTITYYFFNFPEEGKKNHSISLQHICRASPKVKFILIYFLGNVAFVMMGHNG